MAKRMQIKRNTKQTVVSFIGIVVIGSVTIFIIIPIFGVFGVLFCMIVFVLYQLFFSQRNCPSSKKRGS